MLRGLVAGFALVSLCVVIHTIGLLLLAGWTIRHSPTPEFQVSLRRYFVLLTSIFAIIVVLHLVESLIWAAFFDLWSLFGDFETSWYFSLGSYTTIGYGDVLLPAKWRVLGGLEGITGTLLCGLSTAFLFVFVNAIFASVRQRRVP
ncbi:MAG TPA: ion channel [Blastocatellia bacterium]|nr:ion channel [Blastocatellia bacterium]